MDINNNPISDIFNKCVRNMTVAEIKQYFLREKLPSFDEYINICIGKTAGLFSAVLSGCALHLGLNQEHASEFGEKFGVYFQIKNDLTEYSLAQDRKNKIHTAVDILGIENTKILLDNYKQELRELISAFPNKEGKSDLEAIVNGL